MLSYSCILAKSICFFCHWNVGCIILFLAHTHLLIINAVFFFFFTFDPHHGTFFLRSANSHAFFGRKAHNTLCLSVYGVYQDCGWCFFFFFKSYLMWYFLTFSGFLSSWSAEDNAHQSNFCASASVLQCFLLCFCNFTVKAFQEFRGVDYHQ